MSRLEEYNLDTVKLAITRQRELLCQTSEKNEKLYDERLDQLNSLMIIADRLKNKE